MHPPNNTFVSQQSSDGVAIIPVRGVLIRLCLRLRQNGPCPFVAAVLRPAVNVNCGCGTAAAAEPSGDGGDGRLPRRVVTNAVLLQPSLRPLSAVTCTCWSMMHTSFPYAMLDTIRHTGQLSQTQLCYMIFHHFFKAVIFCSFRATGVLDIPATRPRVCEETV